VLVSCLTKRASSSEPTISLLLCCKQIWQRINLRNAKRQRKSTASRATINNGQY
jgi:hypothetical protein